SKHTCSNSSASTKPDPAGWRPKPPSAKSPARWSTLTGHTGYVTGVAFSPDGLTLATSSNDGTVRLRDLPTQRTRTTFTLPGGTVNAVALSPDGKTLAAATKDRTIRLWDVELSAPVRAIDKICGAVARELTAAERQTYLPDRGPTSVCPGKS
ncbi:hypothetical protein, partial [Streptomyces sp. NPDC005336]|uniref:WD40 repeat domain-containing protein n=1 Tax=Streptomyces sp. NPDC005336 TaxID=3157035 RepID=UPI0033AFEE41